ncbi:hypothetical protein NP233_g12643 [Leucocoprinus birnbaumii]|uniref:BTB domain-containing protein n=1 Tax=Leucocoprinus birnbaumii TaxID=56174 RepID=A0AAD5YMV7_9AGAR|nr:hypothetical protein NP233_g12643 [Leucocoprinus birnbaumii]
MMAKDKPVPHQVYNIRGGDLYLRVDKTIFRIHSYFFLRESKYWNDELVGPISPGDEKLKNGQDEKNAIVIDDEKPEDLAQFLWVFYNNSFGNFSKASREDWSVILHFAAKWGFKEVKELAITKWPRSICSPHYVKLAERKEMLGLEEARALGMETYVTIQQARERLRAQVPKDQPMISPIRKELKTKDISDIVASTFNIKLEDPQPNGA